MIAYRLEYYPLELFMSHCDVSWHSHLPTATDLPTSKNGLELVELVPRVGKIGKHCSSELDVTIVIKKIQFNVQSPDGGDKYNLIRSIRSDSEFHKYNPTFASERRLWLSDNFIYLAKSPY